jgi:LAS superfamily LD-carboxypeptidase LdcB
MLSSTDIQTLNEISLTDEEATLDPVLNFEDLYKKLTTEQITVLEKLKNIDPSQYGFKGELIGIEPVPSEFHIVKNQTHLMEGELRVISDKYVPIPVWEAFKRMQSAFLADYPDSQLLIESAYRSPAYQMVILVYYLKMYSFDLAKTLKRVALPQYSQHCSATKTAIDVINGDGIPNDTEPQNFQFTPEYKWLKQNAESFSFFESYPRNNNLGVMYEPWHWQFINQQ